MKFMNRLSVSWSAAFILALVLIFSSGCGKQPSAETNTTQTTPSAPASTSEQRPVQLAAAATPIAATNTESGEAKAFADAEQSAMPTTYLKFYNQYPKSAYIKAFTGPVRSRYWLELFYQTNAGVLLTVYGSDLLLNTSLSEAKLLGAIHCKPEEPAKPVSSRGWTFDYTRAEITAGSCLVDGEEIEPTDSSEAIIICNAAGDKLLSVDLKQANVVAQADHEATYRPKPVATSKKLLNGITQRAGSNGGWVLDKEKTPITQEVVIEWSFDPSGHLNPVVSFP